MFHFENEKIENTEKPQEYKKEGDSGWLNIPFKGKNNENGDELSDKNFHNQEKKPWVEIPYDGDYKHIKDKPWVNLPFQHFENDDDSYDEDSIREDDWESDEFEGYETKSEKKQWEVDHPNGPSFEEALADDEENGTSTVDDWRDYRDAKCDSDDPELFESYEEWQEKKERWDETHPNGPNYAEARQDGIAIDIPNVEPNSEYNIDGHTYKTDDSCNIYNVDGKNLPNCKYELNGYEYETDEKGRIIRAEGDLKIPEYEPRPKYLPDIDDRRGQDDERGSDDRGHLIAHEFGGADTEGNLVPMNSEVNQSGEYRQLEKELRKLKEEGHDVHVTVEPQYEDDSNRPTSFIVTYTVDDETYEKVITNEAKGGN